VINSLKRDISNKIIGGNCRGNYHSQSPNEPMTEPVGPVGPTDPKKGP